MKLKTAILTLALTLGMTTPLLAIPVTEATPDTRFSVGLNVTDPLGNQIFLDGGYHLTIRGPSGRREGGSMYKRDVWEHAYVSDIMDPEVSDKASVTVSALTYVPFYYEYNLREETDTHRELDVKLRPYNRGEVIKGKVELNKPITSNTKVELYRDHPDRPEQEKILLHVNPDGTYKVNTLKPAKYTLTVVNVDEKGEIVEILSESKVNNLDPFPDRKNLRPGTVVISSFVPEDTVVNLKAATTTQLHVRLTNVPDDFYAMKTLSIGDTDYHVGLNDEGHTSVMRNVEKGKQDVNLSIMTGIWGNTSFQDTPVATINIKEGINNLIYDMSTDTWKITYGEVIAVNGTILPVSVVSKEGRALVPLRAIFEALGTEVAYDAPTGVITGTQGDTTVGLTLNKKDAYVNDTKILLDVPAQTIGGSTYVPVRFIGESLGAKVEWKNNTVIIDSK